MQNRPTLALQAAIHLLALTITVAFVLGAAAIAFASTDSVDRTTGPYGDATEKLPIDITSSALTQHQDRLTMSIDTADAISADQLRASSGAGICWTIAVGSDGPRRYCLARTPGDWVLTAAHGKTIASHTDVLRSGIAVSASIPDLKLHAGSAKWSVTATPATCTSGSRAQVGEKPQACADRAPDEGRPDFSARIWQLRAVGCTAKPPEQYSMGPSNKHISLTFDDGPAGYTPQFLKQLKKLNVHATFFMIGQQVPGQGKLLRQMLDDGHELANHSWNHADLGAGGSVASKQIHDTNAVIKHESGFQPCLFRPPGGSTSPDLVARAHEQGDATILWSVDPFDWRAPGTGEIVTRVMAETHKGGIILEHDGGGNRSQTLAALPRYVKQLRAKGYKFVTVSEQLGFETKYKLVR